MMNDEFEIDINLVVTGKLWEWILVITALVILVIIFG